MLRALELPYFGVGEGDIGGVAEVARGHADSAGSETAVVDLTDELFVDEKVQFAATRDDGKYIGLTGGRFDG